MSFDYLYKDLKYHNIKKYLYITEKLNNPQKIQRINTDIDIAFT